ncbi:piezo-type mechanosensitive ion channel component 1-like isoform X3 [Dysidea avara]|uniref:piezo-type mechanosensitive ion channel component 1-like isoform X3 n=1 Tax=Dysidea avara TaxID=196820 RepID=UPI00331D7E17
MTKSVSLVAILSIDSGFRKVVLPLVLLSASLFRYNVVSLLYFTFMLASVFLPSTAKSKDRIPSIVLTVFLGLISLFMTLAQPLFQISLATGYDDDLSDCSREEKIWRQCGFITFDIEANNVIRHYIPDIAVFVLSLISGLFLLVIIIVEKKAKQKKAEDKLSLQPHRSSILREISPSPEVDTSANLISSAAVATSDPNVLHRLDSTELPLADVLSPDPVTEFGTKIERPQSKKQKLKVFAKLPITFLLSISWRSLYIVFLWFSGVCVASVLNCVYFFYSIYLALCWALHLNQIRIFVITQKVITVLVSLYSAVHLILLYLYQLQSAQELVPRSSLTTRIFGFTGIVKTDCNQTEELLTHDNLEWPIYVNPVSVLILFWLSATEVSQQLYHEVKSKRTRHSKNKTLDRQEKDKVSQGVVSADERDGDEVVIEETKKKQRIVWTVDDSQKIIESIYAGLKWLARSFMEVNFVFTLVAMMVWSVVFPSWTSFVLLMWACIVWVFPKFNAKDIVYYSTPLLVFYAIILLIIQYLYNLDLTEDELESNVYAGLTRYSPPPDGANVLAIVIKSLCTGVFMCSLFEFVLLHKSQWYAFLQRHCKSNDDITLEKGLTRPLEDGTSPKSGQFQMSEMAAASAPIVSDQPDTQESSILTRAFRNVAMPSDPYKYLKQYWIMVTVGAFLLVILVGEVTLFKVVFMIFFLLFIFAYEFFPHNWYKIMEPLWTILVFYAFLELTAIYTYQFSYVRDVWIDALNSSHSDLSVGEILESIGLFEVSIDTISLDSIKDLFVTIVPSAVFVAVMALQLKYFSPHVGTEERMRAQLRRSEAALRPRPLSILQMVDQPQDQAASDRTGYQPPPPLDVIKEEPEAQEGEDIDTGQQDNTDKPNISVEEERHKHIQEVIEKYWNLAKRVVSVIIEIFWRLLEIYLPKAMIFVLFAVIVDEISATHFLVLAILVVAIPIEINSVMYIILTVLISNLVLLKMLYQVALVDQDSFKFSDSCPNNIVNISKPRGKIYAYNYERNDPGWLGFQKVECQHCTGFSDYIKYDIIVLLLLALYYTVARRQRRCLGDIEIPVEDKSALFWGITSEEADRSVIKGIGYLINHVFDFYGLEICFCMMAIAVAVRTDIFGVLYAIALGMFLLTPHSKLHVVWAPYVIIHGCLLLLQYAMLVNVPYGACIDDQFGKKTLPWNDIEPVGLKRWLWLPIANNEYFILNKNWLWADLLIYVAVSAQLRNFKKKTEVEEVDAPPGFLTNFVAFATSKEFADHVKRIMYKHFFWVTLFVVFVAGTSQVSLLGLLYLSVSFVLLWHGQEMLRYTRAKLKRWWSFLLTVVWFVILVKISLQLYTCVYFEDDIDNDCIVVRLFNAQCEAKSYYDPPPVFNNSANEPVCSGLPSHIGIWLDTFAFVIVTVQIVIFSTHRFESIRGYLLAKERLKEAEHATDDLLEKINEELEKTRIKEKIIKENIKTRLLEVRTKYNTTVVEHYLRAGVQLPDHIEFNDEDPIELHTQYSMAAQDQPITGRDKASPLGNTDKHKDIDAHSNVDRHEDTSEYTDVVRSKLSSPAGDSESAKDEAKKSPFQGIWKLVGNGLSFIDSGLVLVINWLRNRSLYYRYLSKKRNDRRKQAEGLTPSPDVRQPQQEVTTAPVTTAEITLEAAKEPSINSCDGTTSADKESGPSLIDDDEIIIEEDGAFRSREDVAKVWRRVVNRPLQFLIALYYAAVANTEYICYFFIVMNVIVNGSVLSLIYAALMFLWGLLSIPWPTRRFWLVLMFYTMFVILVKYSFQFAAIDWPINENSGLYWPHILGVEKRNGFLGNVVWDLLLLISLFFHRSLLIDTGRWKVASEGYLDILPFTGADGTSAIRLILRPRHQILASLSDNNTEEDKKETDDKSTSMQLSSENEVSKSGSEIGVEDEEPGVLSYVMNVVKVNVKLFYRQIISQDISLGAHDYYTASFLMDSIAFIIIAVGFSSFGLGSNEGANGVTTVASYIQDNNIPIPFVAMLFSHFMAMVIDRAIYLRKSVLAKLIFFLFQLVAWHLWLFFILPLPTVTARTFTDNSFAQALYFFKCQYFILSAQQCVSGFPKRVLGYFISKRYNLVASLTFQGYRAIPILPDLKEVMDWMFTGTSLKLFHWLKVQEIWAQLYIIKNLRKREKNDPRVLGQPEGFVIKLLLGGGLLALLILLIWGPLLVIALVNTTNVSNPPVEVSIQLSLGSFEPILSVSAGQDSIRPISNSEYDEISNGFSSANRQRAIFRDSFRQGDFTTVTFQGNSTALWDISPPSRDVLARTLNTSNNSIPMTFQWRVSREPETGLASEQVTGDLVQKLMLSDAEGRRIREQFSAILAGSTGSVNLPELYPRYIYAPANGPSEDLDILNGGRLTVSTSLQSRTIMDNDVSITQEWWTLSSEVGSNSSDVVMIFYSERVSQPIFSFIAGLGIIGLYLSVVLVIGRALRSYVAGLPSRITFNEIPNPDSLLELCDDIFYVREDGNLQEEEILVGRLFFIFRSPTRLIQQTKWKRD